MNEKDMASIYHEKQMKELCALHALNNLLQDRKAFSKKELDNICITLSPARLWNPHRSILGLGNYDVNVIIAALQSKNYETLWFDKRRSVDCLLAGNICGFILNIPSEFKLGLIHLPFRRKHWIAIRRVETLYYNLDSKLDGPECIGQDQELQTFLTLHLASKDTELLLVVTPEIYQSGLWKRDKTDCQIELSDSDHSKQTLHAADV